MTAALRLTPRVTSEIDPAILAAAQRGDRLAQAQFVRRYAGPVWSLTCRILGPSGGRSAAEDAAQETLCAALRALPRFRLDGRATLTTWVLTIATRTALRELQRRRDVGPLDELVLPAAERTDATFEQRALGHAIATAVERLSPEMRAAFVLRAYHELEYAEIAEILAIDLGTVKSRLSRARAALRGFLAEVHRGS